MKLIFVIDSLTDIKYKLNLFSAFGNDTYYVVNSHFEEIIKTFGVTPNAVYTKKLTNVIHLLLERNGEIDNTIIYYSSLYLDADFLAEFIQKIGNGSRAVNVVPQYNISERSFNVVYNSYVKSVFKIKDSLSIPKLQYLPAEFVAELLRSHVGNRLFELEDSKYVNVYTDNKKINKSLKVKTGFNKFYLIPIIVALVITAAFLICLAYLGANFILILSFIALYIIDIIFGSIYCFKLKFDARFLKGK